MKSGISDYSENLIYGLSEFFQVTLLIDDYRLQNTKLYEDFDVVVHGRNKINPTEFDCRIYNIGNNPNYHSYIYDLALRCPGMVILHDFSLYYLAVGFYQKQNNLYGKVFQTEGPRGIHLIKDAVKEGKSLLEQKDLAALLPLNSEILSSPNLIMVHSNFTYNNIIERIRDRGKVRKINMVELKADEGVCIDKSILFEKYGIPQGAFVITSLGFIDPTKLNYLTCKAVERVRNKTSKEVVYVMAGDGDYVDELLCRWIIKTGYTSAEEFWSLILYSDLIVNLRFPSMGETSAALICALGAGKSCIVSDDAWFSELPDNVVTKVNHQNGSSELYENILCLIGDGQRRHEIGRAARQYIEREHNLRKISQEIFSFVSKRN